MTSKRTVMTGQWDGYDSSGDGHDDVHQFSTVQLTMKTKCVIYNILAARLVGQSK